MIAFADSSALVAHYDPSETDVLPDTTSIAVSALARVEVPSALWRKARDRAISPARTNALVREFEADWHGTSRQPWRFAPVALVAAVLERAAAIAATHGLRSLDAIQLASALAVREVEPACRTMVVLDATLRRAAATERFDLLPA